MKKTLLSVGAACFAAVFATGCVTSEGDAYIAELDEFITGSKALEKIEPTKHPVVDPLILGSTMLYVNVGGEMRETIETRFGAAYIITANKGLRNDKWEGIAKGEQKSFDELFADFETEVFPKLEGCPKDATAKTIFEELCDKRASYDYSEYVKLTKTDKAKADAQYKEQKAWLDRGKEATRKTVSSIDWKRKEARRAQLKADMEKMQKSMAETTTKLKEEMTVLQGQLSELSKNSALTSYLGEISPLIAKKTFASAEACKEIDKQIDAIAAKPEYKTVVALQKELTEKIKLTGNALAVLGEKVGGQLAFTAKAIPWMIESDNCLQATEEDKKQ